MPTQMKKTAAKPNLLIELTNRKIETQKAGGAASEFGKFKRNKSRNENNSNVGPAWGPRKGN